MKNHSLLFAILSFLLGTALGLFLIVTATWADMESTFYGFDRLASAGLGGFNCPAWMTREETREIALNISNTTEGPINPSVKAEISTPVLQEEFVEHIQLAPGESKKLQWVVGPENIDLRHFIFAKVLVYSAYPLPSRETTCGIYIIDLPGSSKVILPILVGVSLLGMGWGMYRMNKWGQSNIWLSKNIRSLSFLTLLVALGVIVALTSAWMLSVLLLALALLMIMILLSALFMSWESS